MLVTGFHGTTLRVAKALCDGSQKFLPSVSAGDWLGYGAYFFEGGPRRALTWARLNLPKDEDVAVVRAEIDLSNCLDLLDISDFKVLQQFNDIAEERELLPSQEPLHVENGRARPPKSGTPLKMRNQRDRFVIDFCVTALASTREITTVRSAFLWGHALSTQSCIFDWSRVEIAVRKPDQAIKKMSIV